MPKKLTYEYVYNYFKEQECELLENDYINAKNVMKYKCICGNNSRISWDAFKRGQKCRKCAVEFRSKKRTYSQEYIDEYFLKNGYINQSIYEKNNKKLKIICPEGHDIFISFHSFRMGNRCSKCAGNHKLTQEYVDNYFERFNYKNLSKYKNAFTILNVICDNGHEIKIKYNNFQQGSRCRICSIEKKSGENNYNWKNDRTRSIRLQYLKFNLKNKEILSDNYLYEEYSKNLEKYSIDHIFPRVAFIDNDLDKIYDKKIIKEICNSRDNLQIITKEENGSKGGKFNQEEFLKWFFEKLNKKITPSTN